MDDDKSMARIEVVHFDLMNEEVSEKFETITEGTGRFMELRDQGRNPRLYVLKRIPIRI